MSDKDRTFLTLKYGDLDSLLFHWALSEVDYLSERDKQILADDYNAKHDGDIDLEELKEIRMRNLRVKHGVFQ